MRYGQLVIGPAGSGKVRNLFTTLLGSSMKLFLCSLRTVATSWSTVKMSREVCMSSI